MLLIVSPVASAAAMIAVPSMSPSDDQRAAARAAADVADAEPEEDPVAQREHGDRAERDRDDDKHDGQGSTGMPKSLLIGLPRRRSHRARQRPDVVGSRPGGAGRS